MLACDYINTCIWGPVQVQLPVIYWQACLYGKLSTKLLAQAANKNTKFMFMKLEGYFLLKGYLCYKMTTSQNVSSEAEVKNFFIS